MLPHHCILCGAACRGRDLCEGCHADLPWPGPACGRCARPLPAGDALCGACLRHRPPQVQTRVALLYEFPVDQLVLKLKFGNSLPPGRVLGELLAEVLMADRAGPDAIVPVPLHPQRQRERGYNQALEIARPVARSLRVPLWTHACHRARNTAPQSGLAGKARRRNLKGAFTAEQRVAGAHVAVVDDVYTTGNTVAALASALYRAGARRVDAWCVARARRN